MGRKCFRRLVAMLTENVEPTEGSYSELAGCEKPGPSRGRQSESEMHPCRGHRHHHKHHQSDGCEASPRRHGSRHRHRRQVWRSDHPAAPDVLVTGMPAGSSSIAYPEIYKAADEEPALHARPHHRGHHHDGHGHVHHHFHGEGPHPQSERRRRHGCRRHSHHRREHMHFHYNRDSARPAEGVPSPVAVGQPVSPPAKPSDLTRRSSI